MIRLNRQLRLHQLLLNRNIECPAKFLNQWPRIAQIFHARLWVECSSSNSHLGNKDIVVNPLYSCLEFGSQYCFPYRCPEHHFITTLAYQITYIAWLPMNSCFLKCKILLSNENYPYELHIIKAIASAVFDS